MIAQRGEKGGTLTLLSYPPKMCLSFNQSILNYTKMKKIVKMGFLFGCN